MHAVDVGSLSLQLLSPFGKIFLTLVPLCFLDPQSKLSLVQTFSSWAFKNDSSGDVLFA
uniref:Uncharacterized protein n=1 Tax=Arundo donax TaxID=35708 RepID=A0A0A9GAH3_ARUDO